ncbi:MAG: hypothetical protein AAB468_01015 [Patescibacteria group bacterium]
MCDYGSLISPLPGILFIYLAFAKSKSLEIEGEKKKLSKIYFRRLFILLFVALVGILELFVFGTQPILSFMMLVFYLGFLLLSVVWRASKTGGITFFREGLVGFGFNSISKNTDRFSFYVILGTRMLGAVVFICLGIYLLFLNFLNIDIFKILASLWS